MKLLILTNNPSRASFRLRIEAHLEALRQQGIEGEVFAMPRGIRQRWALFRSSAGYDAIMIHRKCLNVWDARVLSRYAPVRIFDFDDAIMHSVSRPDSERSSHYRLFRRTARMMDVMIAGNETLAGYARRYCKQVYVLPTGLDVATYQTPNAVNADGQLRLVWIGSESTLTYLEQLKPALEDIGKRHKNVVLRIIADRFFDLESMPVEKCTWSVQTEAADLSACDIGLSPLPDDRFTRGKCGFKILQYFASGLPVIASPVGVNETFIRESGGGLLAETQEDWKIAIEKAVGEIESFRQWGEKGRAYVQAFDRAAIGRRFGDILKSTVNSNGMNRNENQ